MYLIVIVFYLIGIVSFIETILEKWGFFDYLQLKGSDSESMFLYKLTSCRFCMRFHLTWITFVIISLLYDRNVMLFLVPFAAIGFIKIIKCKK